MNYGFLRQRQAMTLEEKILMTNRRVKSFYDENGGNIVVSFSGGKDSTVLLHLIRRLYPRVKGVFSDTGLEYPEIVQFVKETENIEWIRPKRSFKEVIERFGYPLISKEVSNNIYEVRNTNSEKLRNKRLYGDAKGNGKIPKKWQFLKDAPFEIHSYCCSVLKKRPFKKYKKEHNNVGIVIGTMAQDSRLREQQYLKYGCNNFHNNQSRPMGFWLEEDIWDYIKKFDIPYSKIYDLGYKRTGCMFCAFGIHLEKEDKFDLMAKTHPSLHKYVMNQLGLKEKIQYLRDNGIKFRSDKTK